MERLSKLRRWLSLSIVTLVVAVVALCALPVHPVLAVTDTHWIVYGGTGTGNWSDTNHWDNGVPTSSVNAIFNASSFNGTGQTVTVDANGYCASINFTGATNSPTLAFSTNILRVYGDITFIAAMTTSSSGNGSGSLRWVSTGTCGITTNGLTLNLGGLGSGLFIADTGTFTFNDNLTTDSPIAQTAGTLNIIGKTVSCFTLDEYSNTGSRVLNITNSTITTTYTGGTSAGAAANLSLTSTGSTVNVSGSWRPYSYTWGTVNLTGASPTIYNSGTYSTLALPSGTTQTITVTDGTIQTATTWTISGSSGHVHEFKGSSTAGYTLAESGGSYVLSAYVKISYCTGSTDKTWYFGAGSTDNGHNNSYCYFAAPSAPTNMTASDGTYTNKVKVDWTASAGALNYIVYRDAGNISGTLGDVSTYDDTGAALPTITKGTVTASDGSSTSQVVLTLSGASANNGTTSTYYVVAVNPIGSSVGSTTNDGYTGVGALTIQWQVSSGDSDATYSNIGGATSTPYNYTSAPVPTITAGTAVATDGTFISKVVITISGASTTTYGRYFKCVEDATGATQQTTLADRGYIGVGALSYQLQRSAGDSDASYSNMVGATSSPYDDTTIPNNVGRYYHWLVNATGAAQQTSVADRGYRLDYPLPITNFTVSINGNNLDLVWTKSPDANATMIIRSDNAYPSSPTDGVQVYDDVGDTFTDAGANSDITTYYYSAWSYNGLGYSTSYLTGTGGGSGMTALSNMVILGILLAGAIVLTIIEAVKNAHTLGMIGGLLWIFAGVEALSVSTSYNSLMYWLGIASILLGIAIAADGGFTFTRDRSDARRKREEESRSPTYSERLKQQKEKLEAEDRNDAARATEIKRKREMDKF